MFVHYLQIIANFLFFCQSVSRPSFLIKLGQIGISPVMNKKNSENVGGIPGISLHYSEIITNFLYVCILSGLPSLLLGLVNKLLGCYGKSQQLSSGNQTISTLNSDYSGI